MNAAGEERAIDVGFGGEVDDGVAPCDRFGDGRGIGDIAVEETHPRVVENVLEVEQAPRIGELVEDDDFRDIEREQEPDEVAADEASTTCDEDATERSKTHRPLLFSRRA